VRTFTIQGWKRERIFCANLKLPPEALCLQVLVSHDDLLHCGVVELEPAVLVGVDGSVALTVLPD
jgi:hypothetical protein